MVNIKKSIRKLLIVVGLLLVGQHAFHVHQQQEHDCIFAKTLETSVKDVVVSKSGDCYNYERMLSLLTKLREIKAAYYATFTDEIGAAHHRLDIKEIKDTLADFYREQARFSRYILHVRYFYKGEVPRKRAYSLRDHSRVLEKSIADLERILRNF